jgi:cardiolipin synthase
MTAAPAVPDPVRDPPSTAIAVQLPAHMRRYARALVRWRDRGELTVLREGGETFPAMLAALAGAQRSICFETYILAADLTGDRFKAVLIDRARAGVEVRLIYDAVGSFGLPESWVDEMRTAGCEVIDFNPIAPWRRRFRLSHRDHRKIIVVDDRVAFTGGLNIANDYAALADGGLGWHDVHCRVTGPIVTDLARMFRRTWLRCGGSHYRAPPPASDPPTGTKAFIRLLDNTLRRQRKTVRRAYLHAINAARRFVLIQNAYFLPDRGLRRALGKAVARGVDVRVLVPGRSDVRLIEWAGLYVFRRLARRGVKMFLWRGVMTRRRWRSWRAS